MHQFGQFRLSTLFLLFAITASLYALRHVAFEDGLITRRIPLLYGFFMAAYVRVLFAGSTAETKFWVGFVLGGLLVMVAAAVLRADILNIIATPKNDEYWKWLHDRPQLIWVIVEAFFVGGFLTAILVALPGRDRAKKEPRG